MKQIINWLMIALILIFVTACATERRIGPPAPIVEVTPRDLTPTAVARVPPSRTEPIRVTQPAPPSLPNQSNVNSGKPATQVYTYRDARSPANGSNLNSSSNSNLDPNLKSPSRSERKNQRQANPEVTNNPPTSTLPKVDPVKPLPPKPTYTSPAAAVAIQHNAPPTITQPLPEQPKTSQVLPPPPMPERPTPRLQPAPSSPPETTANSPNTAQQNHSAVAPPPMAPSSPPKVVTTPPPPPPLPPLPPAPPIPAPPLPPAAQTLASQAERQRQAGDYTGAAASLERSLRITPHEAYLWNRLARVRLEQGQTQQASNFAAVSNNFASSNKVVKRDNWRIIAESKRRAGDAAGSEEAIRKAKAD